jgi:pimeloyl-ACP methyl ester carboxylesterase
MALRLLEAYLKNCDRPPHLIGHGLSGWLGLQYARLHPEQVQSLTLLAVGVHPAVDWQAHYYAQRQFLPCSRSILLAQTVSNLFGKTAHPIVKDLVQVLDQDLFSSPSPHSLLQRQSAFPGGIERPLLVCGSADDVVIDSSQLQGWQPWLKPSDRLWEAPTGRHFFHYYHPQAVSYQVLQFWQSLEESITADSITADSMLLTPLS